MYSEHVGWNRHRCGVTSDTVLWYDRIREMIVDAARVNNPRSVEEAVQFSLQISELCTVYARSGDNHHVPSRHQRPATDYMTDTPLDAVTLNRAPYLLPNHQPKPTTVQSVGEHPHHNDTARISPAPAKHSGELLACRQRPQSSHARTRLE